MGLYTTREQKIIDIVSEVTGVSFNDIKSKTRKRNIVQARALLGSILCIHENLSTVRVGLILNIDHSSVCYYTKKHNERLDYWVEYKKLYRKVQEKYLNSLQDLAIYEVSEQISKIKVYLSTLDKERKKLINNKL
jgi:hypothetical protein|tara:strand:- start:1092 stop:1496 length:405 start_codon:yes stop_codon:yes gene_type:complete